MNKQKLIIETTDAAFKDAVNKQMTVGWTVVVDTMRMLGTSYVVILENAKLRPSDKEANPAP